MIRNRVNTGYLIVIIVMGIICGAAAAQQTSAERVTVSAAVGKVEVRSPRTGKWREVRAGMPVRMKWDIRTYVESSVDLKFENGTILKLGEKTVLNLEQLIKNNKLKATRTTIKVPAGKVWANVKKLVNQKSEFQFKTPTAVAAIRGTQLGIEAAPEESKIQVFEGRVEVTNNKSSKKVMVGSNETAVVEKGRDDVKKYSSESDQGGGYNPFAESDTVVSDSGEAVSDTVVSDSGVTEAKPADSTGEGGVDDTLEESVDTVGIAPDSSGLDREDTEELGLTLNRPSDGAVVEKGEITVSGVIKPAKGEWEEILVMGRPVHADNSGMFTSEVRLELGSNRIVVEAIHEKGAVSEAVEVVYNEADQTGAGLTLNFPTQREVVKEPFITVSGRTGPEADVKVNGTSVPVSSDGSFNYRMHIPDEEGEYEVTVVSSLEGKEESETREVEYRVPCGDLFLEVNSPQEREEIKEKVLRVSGKTSDCGEVTVNGVDVVKSRNFVHEIHLREADAGEYSIEVEASDGRAEEYKEIDVYVSPESPVINTSPPVINVISGSDVASKTGRISVQALDRTPEDLLTLFFTNNGITDEIEIEPGTREEFSLDEGENEYEVYAEDLAGNRSSVIKGRRVYLPPGQLRIEVNEPSDNPYVVNDLPPMPGKDIGIQLDIEVEIDDGIGDIPETVRYCRVNGIDLSRRNRSSYIFTGRIKLHRGENILNLTAEDEAGNKAYKRLEVIINE